MHICPESHRNTCFRVDLAFLSRPRLTRRRDARRLTSRLKLVSQNRRSGITAEEALHLFHSLAASYKQHYPDTNTLKPLSLPLLRLSEEGV